MDSIYFGHRLHIQYKVVAPQVAADRLA